MVCLRMWEQMRWEYRAGTDGSKIYRIPAGHDRRVLKKTDELSTSHSKYSRARMRWL